MGVSRALHFQRIDIVEDNRLTLFYRYQHGYAQLSVEKYPGIVKWLEVVGSLKEVKAAYEKIPKGQEM